MPNYGRSFGCFTCKQRKVKCDRTRPGCQKCLKIGKSCSGYPNEWDLSFRSENKKVQARLQASQEVASQDSGRHPAFQSLHTHIQHSVIQYKRNHERLLNLSRVLRDDSEVHAIRLFFQDYVLTPCSDKRSRGWLNFLPRLYEAAPHDLVLQPALFAAAYANIAQKTESPGFSIKAISYYNVSLEMINKVLSDRLIATSDVTMTAVLLLGLYECINSTNAADVDYFHHSEGLGALADLRGSLLTEGSGLDLLQIVCCQMQRRNLDLKIAPGPTDERLIGFLDPSLMGCRMIFNMFDLAHLIAKPRDKHWGQSFRNLDDQFCQWEEDAFVCYGARSFLQSTETQYTVYPSIWSAGVWNKHRATRILLHQALLENPDAAEFEHMTSSNPEVSLALIRRLIGDIFESIPFSLGDIASSSDAVPKSVGGYFLVWALRVVIRCPFATAEQQRKAKAFLWRVGKQCGISLAASIAETYMSKPKEELLRAFEAPHTNILAH